MKKNIYALFIIAVFFLFAGAASAHIPRIVSEKNVKVQNPEVSQAFYGELKGTKNVYEVYSAQPFDLYVSVLVPDVAGARKDMSAEIYQLEESSKEDGTKMQMKTTVAMLDGINFNWSDFYEPWGGNKYFQGPQYSASKPGEVPRGVQLQPGTYYIQVFNPDNEGKYSLVVGTKEQFSLGDMVNTVMTMPGLEMGFFGKSPLFVFWNLTGLFILLFVLMVVLVVWAAVRSRKRKRAGDDAEISDRYTR